MTDTNQLADLILEDRRKGLSYHQIGQKHGMSAEDARALAREILERTNEEDEWELRAISLLRLESVIQNLWTGVENGSFKHAEALFKGLDQINQLLALNKQVVEERRSAITDEQASIIYHVLRENNRQIFEFINTKLKPNKKQQEILAEWPAIEAEASNAALEATILEEDTE